MVKPSFIGWLWCWTFWLEIRVKDAAGGGEEKLVEFLASESPKESFLSIQPPGCTWKPHSPERVTFTNHSHGQSTRLCRLHEMWFGSASLDKPSTTENSFLGSACRPLVLAKSGWCCHVPLFCFHGNDWPLSINSRKLLLKLKANVSALLMRVKLSRMVCTLTREIFSPNDRLYLQNVPIYRVAAKIQHKLTFADMMCTWYANAWCKWPKGPKLVSACAVCILIEKRLHEMPRN